MSQRPDNYHGSAMYRYAPRRKTKYVRAYLRKDCKWQPIRLSTEGTIMVMKTKSGKRKALSLYCCRLFRWPFFRSKRGLLVQSYQGTVVLGFDTKEQRRKWNDTFCSLRTIEANLATYTARPIQHVAPSNQAKYFAMCKAGLYKPEGTQQSYTQEYRNEFGPDRRRPYMQDYRDEFGPDRRRPYTRERRDKSAPDRRRRYH